MKKLMTVLACVLSLSAFATSEDKVTFTYSGMHGWGSSYYSCDYVEAQAERHLETLGATQIRVRCSGGLETGRMWPISVTARFVRPLPTGNDAGELITIKGDRRNPSCNLNVAIMRAILPKFPNVSVVSKNDSCAFANSNYSYELSIVR